LFLKLSGAVRRPASLALGTAWSVRDLDVAPAHRRMRIARIFAPASHRRCPPGGRRRVSLQTETGNTPALTLHAAAGFQPVTGLELLTVDLARDLPRTARHTLTA
jgi:GNAT superfamily N-acetyltransferase